MRSLRILSALGLTILFTAAALAQDAPPPPKQADILIFANGDQLTGHLVRAAGGSVVFNSDMAGELTIPLDKVKELRSGGSFSMLKNGPPSRRNLVGQGQISVAQGNVIVSPPSQPSVILPVKQLGWIIDTPTYDREVNHEIGLWHGWNGGISGGATLVRATDNITSYTAAISLVRLSPTVDFLPRHTRTTFDLSETYGTASSKVIPPPEPPFATYVTTKTNIFNAAAEKNWYFTPRFYELVNIAFAHNLSQGLRLQQLYGAGIGWTPIQEERQELDLKADVHYQRQSFYSQPDLDLIGSIFGETYRRVLPRKIVFTQAADFIPAWNDTNAWSAMASVGIVLPTWKRLGVNFNVINNYLNNPPPFYKANSFQFVAGVAYTLR